MSKITWFGHSAFKLEAGGASVVIDPFFAPHYSLKWQDAGKPDVVLVTHDHGDHTGDAVTICKETGARLGAIVGTAEVLARQGVPGKQLLNGVGFNIGGTLEERGMRFTMTQAFHSSDSGMPVGYIVTMPDGLTVYHAGDTGIFASMELLGRLYDIDLALLPIGGIFTMDAFQAAQACVLLNCKKVIPMHWGTFPVLAQSPEQFIAELARLKPDCQCHALQPGETVACAKC